MHRETIDVDLVTADFAAVTPPFDIVDGVSEIRTRNSPYDALISLDRRVFSAGEPETGMEVGFFEKKFHGFFKAQPCWEQRNVACFAASLLQHRITALTTARRCDVTRIGGVHLLLIFIPPRVGFNGLLPSAKDVVLGRPLISSAG